MVIARGPSRVAAVSRRFDLTCETALTGTRLLALPSGFSDRVPSLRPSGSAHSLLAERLSRQSASIQPELPQRWPAAAAHSPDCGS